MIDISIVTITFNNFDELVKTLDSTENVDCERIVINGGSCQKTNTFLAERKDLISLSERDQGISDAFNKGIQLATKKAIWFLNSGDVCLDKSFITFADKMIPAFDFVYSPIVFDDPEVGQFIMNPIPDRPLGLGIPYLHPGFIVSSRVFREVGLFDLNFKLAMDYELMCRMQKHEYKGQLFTVPSVLMDGSGVSKQKPFKGHIELGRALRKNSLLRGKNLFCYGYRTLKLCTKYSFYFLRIGFLYEAFKKSLPTTWRK
jgi:GT2 family glycosyltransferase